jgi:hypothetical protein
MPSTVDGEMTPGHREVPRTCIRVMTLLDTILGVGQRGAERWVVETGIDMARFGSSAHVGALGRGRPNDASAGKQRYRRTRHGNQPLRTVLTQLAHTALWVDERDASNTSGMTSTPIRSAPPLRRLCSRGYECCHGLHADYACAGEGVEDLLCVCRLRSRFKRSTK